MDRGQLIVATARSWIGTPFLLGGFERGRGADCLSVVRACAGVLGLPVGVPHKYRLLPRGDELLSGLSKIATRIKNYNDGDIILTRDRFGLPGHHLGIVADGCKHIIHCDGKIGVVEEKISCVANRIISAWRFK